MNQERLLFLLGRYADQSLSVAETTELRLLLNDPLNAQLVNALSGHWLNGTIDAWPQQQTEADIQLQVDAIVAVDKPAIPAAMDAQTRLIPVLARNVHRVHFLRRWGWAAAVLITAASVTAILFSGGVNNTQNMTVKKDIRLTDIAPGGNKATLTLADGTTIVLDSIANGSIAQQGIASVVKRTDGQLVYQLNGAAGTTSALLNTMTTPRGGQYQLELPDGSKVWLNAASAITYPVQFNNRQRKVRVSGEAYFEVAKDAAHPFIVETDGQSFIEVLGTHFNVHSYRDEALVKTTLLEGSVKVVVPRQQAVLFPGQQAAIPLEASQQVQGIHINAHPSLERVMAWKNGIFDFQDASFREVAKQLERWYDIQVIYESAVPDIQFKGDMNRGVPLSGVLRLLAALGIQTRIEGRKLFVQ